MKKFLIGLVTGIVLCGLIVVILAFSLIRLGSRPPTIADGSTLIMKLNGEVPERAPTEVPIPFFEQQSPLTVADVWLTLRKAAADSRIRAVLFEPENLQIGWARMQELRAELQQFRKSGKPLVALLRTPGTREYYLATTADRIYMMPEDMLDLKGLRVEAMYWKGTLDKVGIQADVIHAGRFKDYGDVYTRESMTPETREVLNDVLDQFYGDLTATIAGARHKTPEQVRSILDKGPFNGTQALAEGLIDANGFEDALTNDLQKRLNQSELTKLGLRAYVKTPAPAGVEGHTRIALVVGEGEITRGSGNSDWSDEDTGIRSGGFTKLLRQVGDDSSIRAAILRINSPGGDGIASDDILHAAEELSHKKPVVISMGDLAASGGYFISMTGDPIVAYPNTLTGSIGVVFLKPDVHGLYDKLGIHVDILQRGQFAGLYSISTPPTPAEQDKLSSQVEDFYHAFLARVAAGRKKPYETVEPLAQGRVWLGAQAKGNGLVDELGGLDRAIELVKQKAKIGAQEQITLVPYPPRRSIFDRLMNREDESPAISGAIRVRLRAVFGDLPIMAITRGGFLKVMPYSITVR
jgi:protease-4